MSKKTRTAEREMRRQRVAVNLLAGMSYREIADALKVSPATICRDVDAIVEEWRAARLDTADKWVSLQAKRIDRAIFAIWQQVLNGDTAAIDRMQKLIEQQGRLLGHDEGVRVEAEHLSIIIDR